MDKGEDLKEKVLTKIKTKPLHINPEEIKKKEAAYNVSPRSRDNSTAKPQGSRYNCLCSPTTHAGSFRCKHHRIRRGGSLGANLASFESKPSHLSDSVKAQ